MMRDSHMGRPWLSASLADYEGLRPDALSLEVGRNPFERRERISEKPPARFPESCLVGRQAGSYAVSDNGCETALASPWRDGCWQGDANATYPANLCPIYCGGAATYSRPRTIILHNEDGDCKSFFETWPPPAREPARCGLRGLPR